MKRRASSSEKEEEDIVKKEEEQRAKRATTVASTKASSSTPFIRPSLKSTVAPSGSISAASRSKAADKPKASSPPAEKPKASPPSLEDGSVDQCDRNPLCVRGFRHRGRGGHCSLRGDFASAAETATSAVSPPLPEPHRGTPSAKKAASSAAAAPPGSSAPRRGALVPQPRTAPRIDWDAVDIKPGENGFVWTGHVIDVPDSEFGEDGGSFYTGTINNTSGQHVQIYFEEDDVAYWFTKRTVASWMRYEAYGQIGKKADSKASGAASGADGGAKAATASSSGGAALDMDLDDFEIAEFETADQLHSASSPLCLERRDRLAELDAIRRERDAVRKVAASWT